MSSCSCPEVTTITVGSGSARCCGSEREGTWRHLGCQGTAELRQEGPDKSPGAWEGSRTGRKMLHLERARDRVGSPYSHSSFQRLEQSTFW